MRHKSKRSMPLLLLFCAGVAVHLTFGQPGDDGKRTFASTCAACHGLDGKGAERGPDIVTRRALQQLPDASLVRIVRNGKPGAGMPSFRSLGEARIQAVVGQLRVLQGQSPATVLPGNPKAGKALFFGKAECSQCHVANGEGGFMGSDLSNYAAAKAATDIRSAITDPNRNLDPQKWVVVVKTADGTARTGIARNEDNFSLQLQTLDGTFHLFDKSELQSIEHKPMSLMPTDYGSKLTPQELDELVAYLMSIAQNHPIPKVEKE